MDGPSGITADVTADFAADYEDANVEDGLELDQADTSTETDAGERLA